MATSGGGLTMGRDTQYDLYKKQKTASSRPLRHFTEYVVLRFFMFLASLLSVRLNQKLGALFGQMAMSLARKDRGIAEYQLGFCFPQMAEKQRDQLLKSAFRNIGSTLFEALVIHKFKANPQRWIELENAAVVKQSLEQGNGLVLMFGHVGNWELLSIVYEMLEIKGIAVESPIGDSKLDRLLLSMRYSENIKMVPRGDKSSARAILHCFRNNQVFLFAMDQDTKVKTVFVDFLGRKAATAIGAATFAQKFKAPVVSAFGARMADGTHRYFFEELSSQPYQGTPEEAETLTQNYNFALEKHIRRYPDQWVWFHRRWKNQPDPE